MDLRFREDDREEHEGGREKSEGDSEKSEGDSEKSEGDREEHEGGREKSEDAQLSQNLSNTFLIPDTKMSALSDNAWVTRDNENGP